MMATDHVTGKVVLFGGAVSDEFGALKKSAIRNNSENDRIDENGISVFASFSQPSRFNFFVSDFPASSLQSTNANS